MIVQFSPSNNMAADYCYSTYIVKCIIIHLRRWKLNFLAICRALNCSGIFVISADVSCGHIRQAQIFVTCYFQPRNPFASSRLHVKANRKGRNSLCAGITKFEIHKMLCQNTCCLRNCKRDFFTGQMIKNFCYRSSDKNDILLQGQVIKTIFFTGQVTKMIFSYRSSDKNYIFLQVK